MKLVLEANSVDTRISLPIKKTTGIGLLAVLAIFHSGCSPEPGSIDWCEKMKQKPTREWNEEEIKSYAGSCLFYKY